MDDAELAQRAQRGDVASYEELVRRHQEITFRVAYLVTHDAAEAEDAAQDAFVKAYAALDRFRPGAPFRPWLLRIVANEARNRRRAAGRRTHQELHLAELVPSAEPEPEAAALAAEQRRELLHALNQMREEERLILTYRYFLECSEAEIAEALGCARGTVKSRLSRALHRLRTRLLPSSTVLHAPGTQG